MAVKVKHDGNATGALAAPGAGGRGAVLRRGGSWMSRGE